MTGMKLYDITVKDLDLNDVPLSLYEGKILLIVNTATHCTYTSSYSELESLYQKHQDKGFEILDFPCNQFHGEAPETGKEIDIFCRSQFHTTFPRFSKVDVNGTNASPLFAFLCGKKKFAGFDKGNDMTPILSIYNLKIDPLWESSPSVKWNFTKFLIDRKGSVVKRFEPTTPLDQIEKAIEKLLDKDL